MTSHPSDGVAQKTFLGQDDHEFRRQQKRKRAPKDALPTIPDGPCCARCSNWQRPGKDDDFGLCREVVVDMAIGTSVRRFMTQREAREQFAVGADPIATRGYFVGCSLFTLKGIENDACGKIGQNRTPVSDLRRSAPDHSSVVAEEG